MIGFRVYKAVWESVPVLGTDFCLGEWIIRPKRCSIELHGKLVHIKPKSMSVLERLARAAGEVVSREQLFESVWPGAIVSDDVLTHSVVELRKAFGDSARDSKVIETIPKNGFRLIPEVTADVFKKEKNVGHSDSKRDATGKKLSLSIIATLAIALGLFTFDKFLLSLESDKAEVTTVTKLGQNPGIYRTSIAVLPFENRSNREEDQFFTDGIHDDLLATIAKIGSMKVISRTSVMEYRNSVKKIQQIATELGVANILEGGIQRSGDHVRIRLQFHARRVRVNYLIRK